jgi:hypothetical protein
MKSMEHAAYMVDVLDARGKVVGHKPRRAINKTQDIHHTIFTILITPRGELVLSVIPPREDLPNLYARQIGATVGTIRRTDETSLHAAHRGLSRELFIDGGEVQFLGRRMMHLPDGAQMLATTYYLVADPPATFSLLDIDTLVVITPRQIRGMLLDHPHELAPTFRELWKTYHHKLPI